MPHPTTPSPSVVRVGGGAVVRVIAPSPIILDSEPCGCEACAVKQAGDAAGHEFHGNQWTGGMGGGDASRAGARAPTKGSANRDPELRVIEQGIAKAFAPRCFVSLGAMDKAAARDVLAAAQQFKSNFPGAAASISSVTMSKMAGSTFASTRGTPGDPLGKSALTFNARWYTDASTLERATNDCARATGSSLPFHPVADPSSVVQHELGHVFDNHYGITSADAEWGAMRYSVSQYAHDAPKSERENFAEAFAARMMGGTGANAALARLPEGKMDNAIEYGKYKDQVDERRGRRAAASVPEPDDHTCVGYVPDWIVAKYLPHPLGRVDAHQAGDVAGHEFHGNQWTGGMGGGDASKAPGDALREQSLSMIREALPAGAKIDLDGMHPVILDTLADAAFAVHREFPEAMAQCQGIVLGTEGRAAGEFGLDHMIHLDEKLFGSNARPEFVADQMRPNQVGPQAGGARDVPYTVFSDSRSVIDHELGHAVYAQAQRNEDERNTTGSRGETNMMRNALGLPDMWHELDTRPEGATPIPRNALAREVRDMGSRYGAESFLAPRTIFGRDRTIESFQEPFAEWFTLRQRGMDEAQTPARLQSAMTYIANRAKS